MNYNPTKRVQDSFSDNKGNYINDILESAKKNSQSEEFKQWTGQTIEKANALLNNPDWMAKTNKYEKDKLYQADEIMYSQAFQDSVADAMQRANKILDNYHEPSGLGNQVKQLTAVINKHNLPELPCGDISKHLHSTDCRNCQANDEL
jgi:hypothetical protein